jgi:ubiquitin conjugation factor E4 B
MWSNATLTDGAHSSLLGTYIDAQRYLAPALLLLYGDVERTGFYDKLTNRRSIMIVLKHLWTLPTHRPAFRGIATLGSASALALASASASAPSATEGQEEASASSSSSSSSGGKEDIYFIRFANGLMNETNALVAGTMEKLGEIKKTQVRFLHSTVDNNKLVYQPNYVSVMHGLVGLT